MRTIDGPAVFLAQFLGPEPPFDRLETLAPWAGGLGFKGVQVPTFNAKVLDLDRAVESEAYRDEITGLLRDNGLVVTELSVHRQGHLVAIHPAYDQTVDIFAPPRLRGNPSARRAWAEDQVRKAVLASRKLGLSRLVGFPGSLLWPFLYLYPPRPFGLVEEGFAELARRWRPILDLCDEHGVDLCFEVHPGEDIHDGASFELFLAAVGNHPRCNLLYDPSHLFLQHIDYVGFLDVYRERIKSFHVKDAEWNTSPRVGTYGGYQGWQQRAGRFRSPGDGDIDFGAIFTRLAENDFPGWATLEWECCVKHPEDGAREGAAFIRDHIIRTQAQAFDTYMQAGADRARNRLALGLDNR
ncbi:MAG TPA: sugar phosphate isomerase/epimerase family protein [Geminicoccus sp.]|nr:sugar phosphate isomerase/epimerase family protein [Geminicoccus sp.]